MGKPKDTIVLTCYARPELAEWVKEEAHRLNVSKSEIIRRALERVRDERDLLAV